MNDIILREDGVLCCPYCEYSYVHTGKPYSFSSNDDYGASRVFNMGVRGDVVAIPFSGECGHEWTIVFGFHKGMTHYKIIQGKDDPSGFATFHQQGDIAHD